MLTPPRLVDHHVHTTFSDGLATPAEIAARAAELGLAGVATVDHLAIGPYNDEPGYSIEIARIDEYIAAVRAADAAHPGVRVLAAIEVDYGPDTVDDAAALLAAHDFDFVYGSVHFIDGRVVDTRASLQGSLWVDVDAVYERYFEVVAEAAATGLFDVIAHLDLPKKFGHRPRDAARVQAALAAALDAIAAAGAAIELNTCGWRVPAAEAYPSPAILAQAAARGTPLVLGSDAHRVDEVGADFARALAVAAEAGYDATLRLTDGELEAIG